MKTYLFTLLLITCSYTLGTSQTINVSEALTLRSDQSYALLGKLKDNILLYRDKSNEFQIQAYNDQMKLMWEKELEFDKKKPTPLDVLGIGDHFYAIYRFKNKGRNLVKVHKYNAAANLVDSTIIVDYGKTFSVPKPDVIVSEDKQHILLFHTEFYTTLEVTSFNLKEMKVSWEEKLAPEDLKYGADFQQVVVDNEGAMHLIFTRENERLKKDHPHYFEILSRYKDKKSIVKTTVSLDKKLTYDVFFKPDNLNQSLIAGGMYSERNKARTQGYYYLNIPNAAPDEHILTFHEFEDAFIEELVDKKNKNNKGIYDVEIQDLAIRRDGGMLFICEQRKESERQPATTYQQPYYGSERVNLAADFYYEDLFIMAVHPDGTKHWEKILHKKQFSQGDGAIFSSFFMAKTPQRLRLIYNDEVNSEGIVSEYVVQGDGLTDRNSVLNTEDRELRLRLKESLQTGRNEIVIPSEMKSKLRLVRMVY